MKFKEYIFAAIIFFLITAVFFYKMFIHGFVPFPGDLLVAEYNPWKTYSYLGYNPGSYPEKAQFFDTLRQIYPWQTFVNTQLKQNQFPLWDPYNFSGKPLFANFQSAVLYPLHILYFFLPQIYAWSILVFLQPFLAGFFTYLYCKKIKLSFFGALLAGISYGFSLFMIVWLEYNTIGQIILWLPLLLLLLEENHEKRRLRFDLLFIFTVASMVFAGHPQVTSYLLMFVFFYAIYRKILNKHIVILSILGLGISAIQIIPGLEFIQNSARSAHSYDEIVKKILIQPWQLVMLIVPDFFGNPATKNFVLSDTYIGDVVSIGTLPLFFISFTVVFWNKLSNAIRFFVFSCFIALIFITSNLLTDLIYKVQLPFISSSSASFLVFLFCFSLSILAGYGFDLFLKSLPAKDSHIKAAAYTAYMRKLLLIILAWVLLFGITAVAAYNLPFKSIAFKETLYEFSFLFAGILLIGLLAYLPRFKTYVIICILLLVIINSWRAFQKFTPFVPRQLVFPNAPIISYLKSISGIQRVWGMGAASIEANFATQTGIYSPDGYDPLYPKWYGEFIQASKDGKIHTSFTDQTRSDAIIAPSSSQEFPKNIYRKKILNLLGVGYILDRLENISDEKAFPAGDYPPIYHEDNWKVYKNNQALPRFFLVNNEKIYKNSEEFGSIFFDPVFDPGKIVLLEKKTKDLSANNMNVFLKSYNPQSIIFKTQTDGTALLFLSDTYYPGWKAFLDGKQGEVLKADYAFRAVFVPKGNHKIVLIFDSMSFKMGLIISLLSIIGVVGYMFLLFLSRLESSEKVKK